MSQKTALDIVVLAGGISHERDVSLRSGRRLADALSTAGHSVRIIDPDGGLLAALAERRPDVIWPTLHGKTGEEGGLLSLLETSGVPIVAPRGADAALAWQKPIGMTLARAAGLDVPEAITLGRETFRDLGAANVLTTIAAAMDFPLIVKPSEGGSAQGVSIVHGAGELPRAMVEAYTYSEVVIVQRFITGTEVTVGVIDEGDGPTALPVVEIEPVDGVYSFDARYNAGETRFYTPARITDEVAEAVQAAALDAHSLFRLRSLSRADFIIDADGTPWFLEVNVLPGFTETSLLPQAITATGRPLSEVYSAIAIAAIGE